MENDNKERIDNSAQSENIPPAPQQNSFAAAPIKKGNGLGVAALIVGIVAIIGAWVPLLKSLSSVSPPIMLPPLQEQLHESYSNFA
jgi:hypothetical protein